MTSSDRLPITITVCTLNEERNIRECLETMWAQNPNEVIVIDGNSDDNTREIAHSLGAKVINSGRKGLAQQRKDGVDAATQPYISIMDADHRPEKDCLRTLLRELEEFQYDGIEAQIESVHNKGYWDWAMEQNFKLTHNIPGPRIMIGTPCLYRAAPLKEVNFDPFFTGPSDDTDLCYRLVQKGYKLGVGSPKVLQEHRSDFSDFRKKWIWYGKGDAQFAWKHPERAASIINHELINYPVKKSVVALRHGQPKVVPFFVLCGLFRHYGFLKEMSKILLLGKRTDNEIYRT